MKALSKLALSGVMISGLLLSATPVFAEDGSSIRGKLETGTFCTTGLATLKTKLLSEFDKRKSEREAKRDEVGTKRSSDRSTWETKINAAREVANTKRDAEFSALENKATTDTQKQAVALFVSTVKTAITTRRAAYDKARKAFQDGVDALVNSHKTQADSQVASYRAAVVTAFTKAETSCAADTTVLDIISTLKTDLANARKTFQDGRQADTDFSGQIKTLEKTRKSAIEAATKAFKETVEQARSTLKASWGTDSTDL